MKSRETPCAGWPSQIPKQNKQNAHFGTSMRLVLCIGITCTVHRAHLHSASPALVLCIAPWKSSPKSAFGSRGYYAPPLLIVSVDSVIDIAEAAWLGPGAPLSSVVFGAPYVHIKQQRGLSRWSRNVRIGDASRDAVCCFSKLAVCPPWSASPACDECSTAVSFPGYDAPRRPNRISTLRMIRGSHPASQGGR